MSDIPERLQSLHGVAIVLYDRFGVRIFRIYACIVTNGKRGVRFDKRCFSIYSLRKPESKGLRIEIILITACFIIKADRVAVIHSFKHCGNGFVFGL